MLSLAQWKKNRHIKGRQHRLRNRRNYSLDSGIGQADRIAGLRTGRTSAGVDEVGRSTEALFSAGFDLVARRREVVVEAVDWARRWIRVLGRVEGIV